LARFRHGEKMAALGNTQYNPASVMIGNGGGSGPYINPPAGGGSTPIKAGTGQWPGLGGGGTTGGGGSPITGPPMSGSPAFVPNFSGVTPESVRASGTGPFDSAYRQNLATYAGGQFQRPGGNLSFNPTGNNLFGNPTGGGNAPLPGLGTSLLDSGLGGQPAVGNTPPPAAATPDPNVMGGNPMGTSWQEWLKQLRSQGIGGGFAGLQS
jgi:hypothetical protein